MASVKSVCNEIRVLSVLFVGFLLIVMTFSVNIDWPDGVGIFERFVYMNRFFTDFFIFAALFVVLNNGHFILRACAYILAFIFSLLYFIQSQSYATISKFLPQIALENVDHINFLELDNLVFSGILWSAIFIGISVYSYRLKSKKTSYKVISIVALLLIVVTASIKNDKSWISEETYKQRLDFYNSGRPGIKRASPISVSMETYFERFRLHKQESFLTENAEAMTAKAAKFAKENLNYLGVQDTEFPLMRTTKFDRNTDIIQAISPKNSDGSRKKNVILFLTEGISANLVQPYHDYFSGLTPNLENFSKQAIHVTNYFNHTYATYRGIGGQLCSLFPIHRLYKEINYYCLGHALSDEGYQSRFMVSQGLDNTDLDLVLYQSGFDDVDGMHDIANLLSVDIANGSYNISDRTLVDGLIVRLKDLENSDDEQPFIIGLYNIETHTGKSLTEDNTVYIDPNGSMYEDTNTLNTVHNFDKVFGGFWAYFKNSSHYDDTIVIVTSDHATYPSREYIELIQEKGVPGHPIFVDEIPLLIYHPELPTAVKFDAQNSNSLSLAPSILHLIGLEQTQAPFMGETLFSGKQSLYANIGGTGDRLWFGDEWDHWVRVSDSNKHTVRTKDQIRVEKLEFIQYLQSLEQSNKLWRPDS